LDEVYLQAAVNECAAFLSEGRLAVVPTDTVYGIAAIAELPEPVEEIFAIKGREVQKALVVMAAGERAAMELAAAGEKKGLLRLARFWPGPLTVVVEAAPTAWLPSVAGTGKLGLRVPDAAFLLALLRETGPLAVTSANLSGRPAPASFEEIDPAFIDKLGSAILIEGRAGSGRPSTVVEITAGCLDVLRAGEIGEAELKAAWESDTPL
jgi:L-threonylcarbamoyladenylate synthase